MGQIELSGSITFGPSTGGSGAFPSSVDTIQLETTPSPKQYGVASGTLARLVNTGLSYVTLSGIGTTDCVTQCTTLYFRCDAPVKLRMTFLDPDGGADIVSIVPFQGCQLFEFPTNGYLKLLEIKGSARIEYCASGLA
jgi:hypothetical protein